MAIIMATMMTEQLQSRDSLKQATIIEPSLKGFLEIADNVPRLFSHVYSPFTRSSRDFRDQGVDLVFVVRIKPLVQKLSGPTPAA